MKGEYEIWQMFYRYYVDMNPIFKIIMNREWEIADVFPSFLLAREFGNAVFLSSFLFSVLEIENFCELERLETQIPK